MITPEHSDIINSKAPVYFFKTLYFAIDNELY